MEYVFEFIVVITCLLQMWSNCMIKHIDYENVEYSENSKYLQICYQFIGN